MRHLLFAALIALFAIPAQAQPERDLKTMTVEEIISEAPSLHPAALYVLSARLMGENKVQEAANWMYAGQLRYRFHITTLGEAGNDERTLFSALSEQVGRPVNEYIAGNADEWIAAMEWALEWDAANDNAATSKTEFASELEDTRAGLRKLIEQVDSNRDQIREDREANGLPNR